MENVVISPVVIEVALNGMTSKERNPHVPREPAELVRDAVACIDEGASIVHLHAPDLSLPVDETAEFYLSVFPPIVSARPDALVYPTGRAGATVEERTAHFAIIANEGISRISYLDPGCVNFGENDADGLPEGSYAYVNTFDECRVQFELCAQHRFAPHVNVWEPGFLRVALAYHRAGRLPPGTFVTFYFGGDYSLWSGKQATTFGLPPTVPALDAYLDLFGDCDLPWGLAVIGGDATRSAVLPAALERGGHVRVGLEDHAGPRTPSNVELVREAVEHAEAAGRPVATCAEAARLLQLPAASPLLDRIR